jgi:hypothetical protein
VCPVGKIWLVGFGVIRLGAHTLKEINCVVARASGFT